MLTASLAEVEMNDRPWVRAHAALSRLAKQRAAADAEEGRWLLCALRSGAHVHLGFGSFGEYIERLFGYTRRSTQEKLRVAEALEKLPATTHALESGALGWSAVRELTRVAVAGNEQRWIETAAGKTVRQLEQLVEGKSPGDDPSASRPPAERRRVLHFDVAPETFALFREAMLALRRRTESMLDDDSALLLMARHVLGGPNDIGRASYQIGLDVCATCSSARQQAGGELVAVGAEVVEMARCDGQQLGYIDAPAANENAGASNVEVSGNVDAEERHEDTDAGAEVGRHDSPSHRGMAANTNDDSAGAHVGVNGRRGEPSSRAKQPVPPAVRRAVLRRDHECCRVTGCRNATFLDLHHLELRSEGGQNEPENLIAICTVHHRAAHRGELVISGSGTNVCFRHADGTEYGLAVVPQAVDVQGKVFAALRGLGFRESQVRAVLSELRMRSDLRGADAERLLREALQRLTPPAVRPMRR